MKHDSLLAIETPEGVDIQLTPAPIGLRVLAWLIDLVIKIVFVWLTILALALLSLVSGKMVWAAALLMMFFLEWFYGALCESRWGATPGKRAMGLKVVSIRGTPITFGQAMVRSFLWLVDFLPFFYTAALVTLLFSRGQRRLADLAAGTVVILAPEKVTQRNQKNLERGRRRGPAVTPRPPPLPLSAEEKALLVSYYRRAPRYHELYRRELAELLEPLHGQKGVDADECLLAYGAWLSGDAEDEKKPARVSPKARKI